MIKRLILPTIGFGIPLLIGVIWMIGFHHAALFILESVKTLRGENVQTITFTDSDTSIDNALWTRMLIRHVQEDGMVNYQAWLKERDSLQIYLDVLSANPPVESAPTSSQIAYWINAYNAFTIQLILDNYPLTSIKEIGGSIPMINSPWDIKFFQIGGVDFDLNTIEHKILRKRFDEPRIHFAINCASFSCPKLLNTAYEPDLLDEQLTFQAVNFINDENRNRLARDEVQLSKIFNWFRRDFEKSTRLLAFIATYSTKEIDPEARITFLDYDWQLNEAN